MCGIHWRKSILFIHSLALLNTLIGFLSLCFFFGFFIFSTAASCSYVHTLDGFVVFFFADRCSKVLSKKLNWWSGLFVLWSFFSSSPRFLFSWNDFIFGMLNFFYCLRFKWIATARSSRMAMIERKRSIPTINRIDWIKFVKGKGVTKAFSALNLCIYLVRFRKIGSNMGNTLHFIAHYSVNSFQLLEFNITCI